tara:strand:- start:292 stop:516 length:225 start_codon:yes stop_codon:yes gene_type:complete
MKPYLCVEDSREVVTFEGTIKEQDQRDALYFVLSAKDEKTASDNAEALGGKLVRPLTEQEEQTKAEDGSYDIEL